MALKVIIQPTEKTNQTYPVYYALIDGVKVLPSGALMLVSGETELDRKPTEFRIYAPGTWKEVNVQEVEDE